MDNVIEGHAYVIVWDDGFTVTVDDVIWLSQPKHFIGDEGRVHIFPSIFHANTFIKANTLGNVKVTIARAA